MSKPLVSILIVNWNGASVLKRCIQSVQKQSYKRIEIIIVDNASTDDSVSIVQSFKKLPIILITSTSNLGFAEGNNTAVRKARGEYVFLLNSDAMLAKNTLQSLVAFLTKNSDVGIAQPAVLFKNNTMHADGMINSIGSYMTHTGFLYYLGYGKNLTKQYKKQSDIFSAYGAGMMVRRSITESIGLFDPDFFAYFEESDFSLRTLIHGWRIVYVPESHMYHQGGVAAELYGDARILFHSYKNRLCSFLKNFQIQTLVWLVPIQVMSMIVLSFVYAATGRLAYSDSVLRALWWNIIHTRSTLKKRKRIQSFRTVSDISIFQRVTRNPRPSYYLYLLGHLQYYTD